MTLFLDLDDEQSEQLITLTDQYYPDLTAEEFANKLFSGLLQRVWEGLAPDFMN